MRIEKVRIKGFRNFDNIEITFQNKNLIIGANDVGKSNLLYALRLLFDKSLSENDLELTSNDYNAYTSADTIEITVTITDIVEDCLKSCFVGAIKDGKVIIKYRNKKDGDYSFYSGFSEETLQEINSRRYIKYLNMQYLDANRNLMSFMKREKEKMLQLSKSKRNEEDTQKDDLLVTKIQEDLNKINLNVNTLNFISSSLESVNEELEELSIHNEGYKIRYVSGDSNVDEMLNNLVLSYSTDNGPLSIGGDGRNNQVFLATWIAKQKVESSIDHVTFYAIEEPEAHLHPHQQRKLSEYIQNNFNEQILITTHSPQIISRFDPANVIRLYLNKKNTCATCETKSEYIKTVFDNFGYRLNTISAETFFSDGVFLVEGTSEVLFYTAVCKALDIDLDKLNISILSVEGIGFKPYVAVCKALDIPWVLRTDNDIFKKPNDNPTNQYYAGVSRAIGIIKDVELDAEDSMSIWKNKKNDNEWEVDKDPSEKNETFNRKIKDSLKLSNIYLSNVDLENDLAKSPLQETLFKHYNKRKTDTLVKAMQKKKAENMLAFLEANNDKLSALKEEEIMEPIKKLVELVRDRL